MTFCGSGEGRVPGAVPVSRNRGKASNGAGLRLAVPGFRGILVNRGKNNPLCEIPKTILKTPEPGTPELLEPETPLMLMFVSAFRVHPHTRCWRLNYVFHRYHS